MNWYKNILSNRYYEMEKDAGFFSGLYAQMALAVSLLLSNTSITEAAEKSKLPPGVVANIPIDALKNAKTNEEKLEIMKRFMGGGAVSTSKIPTQKNQTKKITPPLVQEQKTGPTPPPHQPSQQHIKDSTGGDRIVKLVLQHENLLPKQTPFRITNKEMGQWNHIYGFEVDKDNPKTPQTKNFFYLKRSEDVVPAVKALFKKYVKKYNDPTLEKAIRIFDHEHPDAKISFILKNMPSINMKAHLSTYF